MKYKIVMLMALLFVGCVSSGPHTRGEFDIILTPDVWTELQETNTYWNRNMIYDASKPFYWAIPLDFRGDCKSMALAKQADLKSKNIPSYIASCTTGDGPDSSVVTTGSHDATTIPTVVDQHTPVIVHSADPVIVRPEIVNPVVVGGDE